jgi:hypothetical protein
VTTTGGHDPDIVMSSWSIWTVHRHAVYLGLSQAMEVM